MNGVYFFVREDFSLAAKLSAHEALRYSLDHKPDNSVTPYPRTTSQRGIFNIPGFLYSFDVDQSFWAKREISSLIAQNLQLDPTVSHTSYLPHANIDENANIEGLDIPDGVLITKISVTTNFDQHLGYVRELLKNMKNATTRSNKANWQERLEKEVCRFKILQSRGAIPKKCQPAWQFNPPASP